MIKGKRIAKVGDMVVLRRLSTEGTYFSFGPMKDKEGDVIIALKEEKDMYLMAYGEHYFKQADWNRELVSEEYILEV